MDLPATFLGIAKKVSAAFGGPFHAGQIVDQAAVVYDDGGSIVSSGDPATRDCLVQIITASDAMKQSTGYVEGDVTFIILASGLTGTLDTDANVEVLASETTPADFVGVWQVSGIQRDTAAIGYAGQGRKL
jgi:hypothetical protein